MNDSNRNFIADALSQIIEQTQISICEQFLKRLDLGFVTNDFDSCEQSIMAMIQNALDNAVLLSESEFDSLLNLYNNILNA